MAFLGGGGEPQMDEQVRQIASYLAKVGTEQGKEFAPIAAESGNLLLQLLSGNIPEQYRAVTSAGAEQTRHAASERARAGETAVAGAGLTGTPLAEALASIYGGQAAETAAYNPLADILRMMLPHIANLGAESQANLGASNQVFAQGLSQSPETGGVAGGLGGALSGGLTGASFGAAFGPLGAGIGGLIGAGIGAYTGSQ